MTVQQSRRYAYDQIARQYERARPRYPEALFDDIVTYANLTAEARILEIGCGTGQATLPLAQRGYTLDGIELGAQLARVARENLASLPKVKIIQADFDTVHLEPVRYDLVLAATAFHWLDPATRFGKVHRLLKARGALALCWHRPVVTDISRAFVEAVQIVYQDLAPELTRRYRPPPHPDEVATEYAELIPASGLFDQLTIHKHYTATRYRAAAYIELLDTFSDHRALEPAKRRRLFGAIEDIIHSEFSGEIMRETVALLYLARRKSASPSRVE